MDLAGLLLGQQATLRIKHNPDKIGRMWANINAINPSKDIVEPSGEWDRDAARSRLKDRALKAAVEGAISSVKEVDVPF